MGYCNRIAFALGAGLALILTGSVPPVPTRAANDPVAQPQNQLASLTLAKGIKSASLFGQGELTPVEPTTTFVNTDLPYAVLKFKALQSDTNVSVRVNDPSGPAFTIDVKVPKHRDNVWSSLDLGLPMFILGTDLETHTGTWTLQVMFNGQPANTATFQWTAASPIQLGKIRDLMNEDPTNADLHWRYGSALVLLGHEQEGVAEIQNAIKLDQRYALYYITLGRVYERQGKQADAVKMFQTALSLHGSYYDAVYAGWAQAHLARLKAH
jgi:tetratricopeptide (TPR) repeat protein